MNLHVDANEELKAAVAYYESCETGLGDEFFAEFLRSVEQIQQHPQAWPITYKDFRRYLIHRFPYALVYRDSGQGCIHSGSSPYQPAPRLLAGAHEVSCT